jgi:hypothetical protein
MCLAVNWARNPVFAIVRLSQCNAVLLVIETTGSMKDIRDRFFLSAQSQDKKQ